MSIKVEEYNVIEVPKNNQMSENKILYVLVNLIYAGIVIQIKFKL